MKILCLSFLCLFLSSCKNMPTNQATVAPAAALLAPPVNSSLRSNEESSDLLLAEAVVRRERLSNIVYDLKLDLTHENPDIYSGDLLMHFDFKSTLSEKSKYLRLDFFEGEAKSISINGVQISLQIKKKYWIELPGNLLKEGTNEVRVAFEQKYSKTGQGLHHFLDPETKQRFIYTQFEPNDAQRLFPCFDQPDLRANFVLSVVTPQGWQVISAVTETSKISLKKQKVDVWTFPTSPQISTYLFSLHAGPFQKFTDTYQRANNEKVPLRIFIRPSLAKYLKVKEWFTITKQGLEFFEKYFGVEYPFAKYDQVIVPEFNMGGMENVAAVTYSEWSVPRSEPTRKMRRSTAGLLLHEMAHMWFGDLVTMAWWNDLWLNESFATYMSALATASATEFKEEWQSFAAHTKRGAYVQDAMITTHPIEANVLRTKEAMSTFDGITYNKGASVLKQLSYHMTENAFQKGIQQYFKNFSYKNTTLKDFIKSLQDQTKKDLNLWADRWLRQSGTDQIAATWKCEGQTLKKIEVTLSPTVGKKFRPQSFEIGLFKKSGSALQLKENIRVDITEPETHAIQGAWDCPDVVYPNYGDHGYVHVRLDPQSLQLLTHDLFRLEDPLTRSMVWNDLWRMTRETQIPLKNYIEIISENFPPEKDEIILQQLVSTIGRPNSSVLYYWPQNTETQKSERSAFLKKMENAFLERLNKSKSGSDEEKFWYDNFESISESPTAIDKLSSYFAQNRISQKFPLDLDRKWGIARRLMRFQHPKATEVFAAIRLEDHSDRGRKAALSVEAIAPDRGLKNSWIKKFVAEGSKSPLHEMQAVLYSLFPSEQNGLKLKFENQFYDYLEKNKTSEEELKTETLLYSLIPLDCTGSLSGKLKNKLSSSQNINPNLKKGLMMSLDEDERCQKIRAGY